MLALSAITTIISLLVAGLLIASVLGRIVTGGIDQRLDAQLTLLASTITPGGVDTRRLAALRNILNADAGWRWRIDTPGGSIGWGNLPVSRDPIAPIPGSLGPPDRHHLNGAAPDVRPRPFDGTDRLGEALHARQLQMKTNVGPVTLTASAPREVIRRPIIGALVPLLVTLLLIGVVLAVAAVVQIRLGLRPVRSMQTGVGRVRAGEADVIDEDQPDELRTLAQELNALIRENEAALAAARASAANLAHALKTPVATLALELNDDPRAEQVRRIDATIRHHLARARTRIAPRRTSTALAPAVRDLVATVTHLGSERAIIIDVAITDNLFVGVDASDLDELAGNLIDNAARHAPSRVSVAATTDGRTIMLSVADDGAGIPAADRLRATQAGVRLDERGDGHGFGLSIVRELAELHGGALALEESPGGGLLARVDLPIGRGATQ